MKLIECYECGNNNSPRAAFCPQCGAPNRPTKQDDGPWEKKTKAAPKTWGGYPMWQWKLSGAIFGAIAIGAVAFPAYVDYTIAAERRSTQGPGSAIAESSPAKGLSSGPTKPTNSKTTTTAARSSSTSSSQTTASSPRGSSVSMSGEIQTQSCAGKPTSTAEKSHRYWEIQCLSETQGWSTSNPPRVVITHAPVACAYLDFEARKKFNPYYGAWEKIRETEGKRYEAALEQIQKQEWAKKGRTFKRVQCTNRLWVTRAEADGSFEIIKKQNHAPPHTLVEVLDIQY